MVKCTKPKVMPKEAAKAALKTYESELQKKYEKDEAFMKEIGKEVEKCEDASEGK
jgi:hypothetical protein